jgi:hypothetical protein
LKKKEFAGAGRPGDPEPPIEREEAE